MSAYLELAVKGERRLYIEAASIVGLITSKSRGINDVGLPDAPVSLILRGGETVEVIGESPAKILVRSIMIRKRLRDEGQLVLVGYLGDDDGEAAVQK